jgi:hypothetical protein
VVLDLDFNDQSMAFLRRFASGELGISNMVDVVVHLDGNSDHVQVAQQDMGKAEIVEMRDAFAKKLEPIVFDAKTVTVAYEHAPNHVWAEDTGMSMLRLRDTWAQLLLEKMKLKGGEKKMEWERYDQVVFSRWKKRDDERGDWDEEELNHCYDLRKTVKTMSA